MRLVWVRGERTQGCLDRGAIARRVVERLGREVFSDSAPRSIEGVVQHEGDRWDAHLYVREADGSLFGSRYLTSTAPDCTALDAAVTLAIALVIDPDAATRPSLATVPPPAPTPDPVAPPAAPSSPSDRGPVAAAPPPTTTPAHAPLPIAATLPNPVPPRTPQEPFRADALAATGRALVAAGVLPAAAVGAGLSVEGPVNRTVQATAGMLYLPEVRTASRDFAFGLTSGWLGACAKPWAEGRVAITACGKILLGAIHSVVYTLAPTEPGDRVWTSAALTLGFKVRIGGPFVAELGGEGWVPFTPYRFRVVGQSGWVFQEGSVSGFVFAGVGVSIP